MSFCPIGLFCPAFPYTVGLEVWEIMKEVSRMGDFRLRDDVKPPLVDCCWIEAMAHLHLYHSQI